MHINSLPSLVFRLIFSRLSLHDLLQAGQVCWLWKEYQLDITRKLHSVTLLIGVETLYNPTRIAYYRIPEDLISESSFTLHHSNELLNAQGRPLFAQSQRTNVPSATFINVNLYLSTVAQLVASFPNVVTLNIAINGLPCNITQNVIYLLNQWNNKLVTLRLWLNFCRQTDESTWPNLVAKLFKSLNSLVGLEHLTLSLYDRTYSPKGLHLDLSILSRLREFNYECANAFDDVSDWMARSGTSAQLQRIGIDSPKYSSIREIASTRIAGKITFLPRNSFYSIRDIATNLSAFTSLTSFDVNFPFSGNENQSFVELFKSLFSLNQLIHLNLHLNGSLTFFNRISTHKLAQLPSVKLLTVLNDASINFTNLESPHWAWIFPNVQILSVQHDCIRKCTNGDILKCSHLDRFNPVLIEAVIEGVRGLLATFNQFPSLRRIYLNDQLPKYTFQDPHVVLKFNFNL